MLFLELGDQELHDALVEVVPTQRRVAVCRLDLEGPAANFQDRDVERAAAQVVDGDVVVVLLVEAVRQCGGGRLIDDAQDIEPRDLARIFGGVALAVIEVGRHGDDRIGHGLAQVGLGVRLELLQDHGGDLRRAVILVAHLHPSVAVARLDQGEGKDLGGGLNRGILEAPADQALDAIDRVLRVRNRLPLGDRPHHALAVLRGRDD